MTNNRLGPPRIYPRKPPIRLGPPAQDSVALRESGGPSLPSGDPPENGKAAEGGGKEDEMLKKGDRVRVVNHRHPEFIGQETVVHEITPTGVVVRLTQDTPYGDPSGFWELRERFLLLLPPVSTTDVQPAQDGDEDD